MLQFQPVPNLENNDVNFSGALAMPKRYPFPPIAGARGLHPSKAPGKVQRFPKRFLLKESSQASFPREGGIPNQPPTTVVDFQSQAQLPRAGSQARFPSKVPNPCSGMFLGRRYQRFPVPKPGCFQGFQARPHKQAPISQGRPPRPG